MTKQVDTVTFHYSNGKTHTIKNVYIDCYVSWDTMTVGLIPTDNEHVLSYTQKIPEDCIVIIARGNDSVTSIWENPNYKLSVKVDVMTAKRRCKVNNKQGNAEVVEKKGKVLQWEDGLTPLANRPQKVAKGTKGLYSITIWAEDDINLYLDGRCIGGLSCGGTVEELKALVQRYEDTGSFE